MGDYMFSMNSSLPLDNFMDIVMQLRGNNAATVRDIVDLRKMLVQHFTRTHLEIQRIDDSLHSNLRKTLSRITAQGGLHSGDLQRTTTSSTKQLYIGKIDAADDDTLRF